MSDHFNALKLALAIVFRKPVPWAPWYNRISPQTAWQVGKIVWLDQA